MTLSDRQQRFVAEYLVDLNATQAVIRAGYAEKAAKVTASRLLTNANVRAALAEQITPELERLGISRQRVLQEFARIAFADMSAIARWDNQGVHFYPSDQLDDAAKAGILSVKVKRKMLVTGPKEDPEVWIVEEQEVRMHDKLRALNSLAKYLGLLTDTTITVNENDNRVQVIALPESLTFKELLQLAGRSDDLGDLAERE